VCSEVEYEVLEPDVSGFRVFTIVIQIPLFHAYDMPLARIHDFSKQQVEELAS
jgi:hypothetical protein